MKVVLYVRVSSEEQAQKDLSIPAQLSCLNAVVQKQGHTVARVFEDAGYSAFIDARSRPDFMKLVRYCVAQKPDAVLVWKYDRFARNVDDSRLYKTLLLKAGVKVISINEPIEDSPSGFLLERMLEIFAEFAPRNMGRDVARGYRKKAEQGKRTTGLAPYGYRLEPVLENGKARQELVPGPAQEVETVRRMFSMSEQGMGAKAIAKTLNLECVSGSPGHTFRSSTVLRMLRNPVYAGFIRHGEVLTVAYLRSKQASPLVVASSHTPLIPPAQYERVQDVIRLRTNVLERARYVQSFYMLKGVIQCGVCGASMTGYYQQAKNKPRKHFYQCMKRMQTGVCTSLPIPMHLTDQRVLEHVLSMLSDDNIHSFLDALQSVYLRDSQRPAHAHSSQSQRLQLSNRLSRLYDALEAGLNVSECTNRIKALEDQLKALPFDPPEDETQQRLRRAYERALSIVQSMRTSTAQASLDMPRPVGRQFITQMLERVEAYADGGLQLTYCFRDDSALPVCNEVGHVDPDRRYPLNISPASRRAQSDTLAIRWQVSLPFAA